MTGSFPFGLPGPTATYASLYVVTLAVHLALVAYVLAGSGFVAVWTAASRRRDTPAGRVAVAVRDWLPFFLGAAITAGVAPLLFLQILYRESFYTANLLLLHRWMAIVPVLIVAFYLLYLAKTERFASWSAPVRAGIAIATFACFAFTAYSWTENHLLALDRSEWVAFYADGRTAYTSAALVPRTLVWLTAAVAPMATVAGWQLRARDTAGGAARLLAAVALAGLAASAGAAYLLSRAADMSALGAPAATPYVAALAVGLAVQLAAWLWQLRTGVLGRAAMLAATAGVAVAMLAAVALREIWRLSAVDLDALVPHHARAAEVGGMPAFFIFLAVNAAVIAWCFAITRAGLRR